MNHSKYFAHKADALAFLCVVCAEGVERAEMVKYVGGYFVHWIV